MALQYRRAESGQRLSPRKYCRGTVITLVIFSVERRTLYH